jgi:hypothetical protein
VAFSGEGWIAAGVGSCSPNTWHSWSTRWWNDSWCYTAGARIRMVKMQGRSFWYDPSFDYETSSRLHSGLLTAMIFHATLKR